MVIQSIQHCTCLLVMHGRNQISANAKRFSVLVTEGQYCGLVYGFNSLEGAGSITHITCILGCAELSPLCHEPVIVYSSIRLALTTTDYVLSALYPCSCFTKVVTV